MWYRTAAFALGLALCIGVTAPVLAQNARLDSLIQSVSTREAEDSLKMAALHQIGWALGRDKPAEAIPYLQRALALSRKLGIQKPRSGILNELGKAEVARGHIETGLNHYFEGLKEAAVAADPMSEAMLYTNIANAYFDLKQYQTALSFHRKALPLKETHGKPRDVAITLLNMGNVYRRMQVPDSAVQHFEAARTRFEAVRDLKGIALASNNMGNVLADAGKPAEALRNYQIANRMFLEMGNAEGAAGTGLNIGGLQLELKQYREAEPILKKALEGGRTIPDASIEQEAHDLLARLYENTGRAQLALPHLRSYIRLNDSLSEATNRGNIEKLRIGFETEKKEQENLLLKQVNAVQRNRLLVALVSAAVIGGLSLLLFWMYRRQRKTSSLLRNLNAQILEMTDEISQQRILLKDQNRGLEQLNQTKDRFFSIIAHDVRSPFFGLLGYAELLKTDLPRLTQEEAIQSADRILRSGRAIHDLFENLLAWSRLELNEVQTSRQEVQVLPAVTGIIDLFEAGATRKGLSITAYIPESLTISTDASIFATIVRNLVSNAIKYSVTGSVIDIEASEAGGRWTLLVRDRGIGIPPAVLEELQRDEPARSRPGTGNEKGTGLGLHVCRRLARRIDGALEIRSTEGQGTTVAVTCPV